MGCQTVLEDEIKSAEQRRGRVQTFRHVRARHAAGAVAKQLVIEKNGDGLRRFPPTRLDRPADDLDGLGIDSDFIDKTRNAVLTDLIRIAHRTVNILGTMPVIQSVIATVDTGWITPRDRLVVEAGFQELSQSRVLRLTMRCAVNTRHGQQPIFSRERLPKPAAIAARDDRISGTKKIRELAAKDAPIGFAVQNMFACHT